MRAQVFLFLALPLQSLRQARYAVTNFVLGRSRKTEAEGGRIAIRAVKRHAGYKGHAALYGTLGKCGGIAALAAGARQSSPDKQTALRLHKRNRSAQFVA